MTAPRVERKRWLPSEDDTLRAFAERGASAAECATIIGRTDAACRARAAAMGVALGDGWDYRAVAARIDNHEYFQREDCGGAVGVRWTTAVRSGEMFDRDICERAVKAGHLKPLADRPNVFSATGK